MKNANKECQCSTTGSSCACEERSDAEVLAKLAKAGPVPPPFQVLGRRPGAASSFSAYRDNLFEQGPLSARDRALVQLTAAVALRLPFCIEKLAKNARKAGVTREEMVQATLIASIQSASAMLHNAHAGLSTD